jgi:endo-1,4-beta-xylanase
MDRTTTPCAILVAVAATLSAAVALPALAAEPSSLRGRLPAADLGVALAGRPPAGYSADELELIRRHFTCLTPENGMKMQHLQPAEGRFDFAEADAVVAFAAANGQRVVGHTLVWARDDCTPAWMFADGDAPADRDRVMARMRAHIREVVGRYRGRVTEWDVVNEALDDGDALLRPSGWQAASGLDFIAEAFLAAREADPDALLIYNDYNTETPAKHEKLLRLLRLLLDRDVPIGAVGIQGHFEVGNVPYERLDAQFTALGDLGLKAVVSELDLAVVPRHRWWADGGAHREELAATDPYADGCPPERLREQADDYRRLFTLFDKHAGVIVRVTFWNLHDGRSWLNDFPWKHVEHPLLFDRDCRPKPAFDAVLEGMRPR